MGDDGALGRDGRDVTGFVRHVVARRPHGEGSTDPFDHTLDRADSTYRDADGNRSRPPCPAHETSTTETSYLRKFPFGWIHRAGGRFSRTTARHPRIR
jgi:hypothetical protein